MINPYFYNRTHDWTVILSLLSPLRPTLQHKIKPSLHYLGLITNLLCILVFIKKSFPKRKGVFFLAMLACADFMYNFTSVLPHFLVSTRLLDYNIYKTSNVSCFMYDYVISAFHFYSVFLTLLITIDRFKHIRKPLRLYQTLEKSLAKRLATSSLLLLSLLIALPHGFLMVYSKTEKDCDARGFFRQRLNSAHFTYYQLYFTFTEPVLIWFIPGVLITCMNVYVVFRILKSNVAFSNRFTVNCGSFKLFKREQTTHKNNSEMHAELVECLNRDLSISCTKVNKESTNSTANEMLRKNTKKSKLSFNQQSHYLTIVMVGFYFILSTIPYNIILGMQNNLTLRLNYALHGKNEYLADPLWIRFGRLREWVAIFRILFISNHCFNFFLYLLFNRLFRKIWFDVVKKFAMCIFSRKMIC